MREASSGERATKAFLLVLTRKSSRSEGMMPLSTASFRNPLCGPVTNLLVNPVPMPIKSAAGRSTRIPTSELQCFPAQFRGTVDGCPRLEAFFEGNGNIQQDTGSCCWLWYSAIVCWRFASVSGVGFRTGEKIAVIANIATSSAANVGIGQRNRRLARHCENKANHEEAAARNPVLDWVKIVPVMASMTAKDERLRFARVE